MNKKDSEHCLAKLASIHHHLRHAVHDLGNLSMGLMGVQDELREQGRDDKQIAEIVARLRHVSGIVSAGADDLHVSETEELLKRLSE